jgi:hypothetical protein
MVTTRKSLNRNTLRDLPVKKEVKGGSDPQFIFEYSRATGRRINR